jgi:hypothetical protein
MLAITLAMCTRCREFLLFCKWSEAAPRRNSEKTALQVSLWPRPHPGRRGQASFSIWRVAVMFEERRGCVPADAVKTA